MLTHWIDNLNDTGRKVLFGVVALILVLAAVWAATDKPESSTPADGSGGTTDRPVIVPGPATAPDTSNDPEPAPTEGALTVMTTPPVGDQQVGALARRAATFAATYQSFRYDDDPAAKMSAIRRQLARTSQVAPELAVPTGAALAAIRADRTSVIVTPTRVRATLIADRAVGFVVDARVATSRGQDVETQQRSYLITFTSSGSAWGVGSFSLDSAAAE